MMKYVCCEGGGTKGVRGRGKGGVRRYCDVMIVVGLTTEAY